MKKISQDLIFDSSEFSSFNDSTNSFNYNFSPEKEFLSDFDYSISSKFFEETKNILLELNKAIQIKDPEINKIDYTEAFKEIKEMLEQKSVGPIMYNRYLRNNSNFIKFNKYYKRKTVPIKVLYPEQDSVSTKATINDHKDEKPGSANTNI